MWTVSDYEIGESELFKAGQKVEPGLYRQVDSRREIFLEAEDFLPASLDGRVAVYRRVQNTWGQLLELTRVS